jgi:hypothetical protein
MNNSGTPQHVCFYSNRCNWSKAFITAVKDTPFVREIQFICVDVKPDGTRAKLPNWLKKVPTLVVKGESEPRTDSEVMNWVSERKLMMKSPGSANQSAEPEPWVGNEMGGSLTKGFSFLGAGDTNDAPMGDFAFLNGQGAVGTKTASDMPGGGLGARGQNKSKKEEMFDKQMEEYMRQRGAGMPQAPLRQ